MSVRLQDYLIVIGPLSEEDGGGFLATVPELPGCMSDGETPQDALTNVYDAILCWIESAGEAERPVPEPMSQFDGDRRQDRSAGPGVHPSGETRS